MYSSGIEDENYLRGIAKTNADGIAWFNTIFPACYSGRWPHIHFDTNGYPGSSRNLAQVSLATDNVFRDDKAIHQLATVTGSAGKGYVANLTIGA